MATATATVDQTYGAVYVVANWTSSPSVTGVALVRVTPDGAQVTVRNSPVNVSGGTALFWDDEAPLNTVVYYITSSPQVTGVAISNSVTITGSGLAIGQTEIGWLKDPIQPSNDVKLNFYMNQHGECTGITGVAITDFGDQSYVDNAGEFPIINAAEPISVAMVRAASSLTLTFTTLSLADAHTLRTIFASGRVLLLQVPIGYGWGYTKYGNEYIHVHDAVAGRPQLQNYHHQQRVWSMKVQIQGAPASINPNLVGSNGIGVGHATWGAMAASGLTWAQLNATGKTYLELSEGLGY